MTVAQLWFLSCRALPIPPYCLAAAVCVRGVNTLRQEDSLEREGSRRGVGAAAAASPLALAWRCGPSVLLGAGGGRPRRRRGPRGVASALAIPEVGGGEGPGLEDRGCRHVEGCR